MKRFSLLPLLLLLFIAAVNLQATTTVRDFELGHVKIPVYQKNKLDFIIFADSGKRRDTIVSGKNTVIDRLLENVDVDKIPDGWQLNIYPLNAKLPEVLKFWQKRYNSSEAVIFTPQCVLDRKTNIVSGTDDVKMRTPSFDLDGIGFRADLGKKIIEVNSDVHIVARRDDSDPREIINGKLPVPAQYNTVLATADTLRLDMEHNEIMLIGSVKIIDGSTTLTCDRLTIFLKSRQEQKRSAANLQKNAKSDLGDSSAMLKGISRILADGDVFLTRRPENAAASSQLQNAWCEHLEYEFDTGRIILTGEDELPKLAQDNHTLEGERIELLRFSRKAFVKSKCLITEYSTINNRKNASRTIRSDYGDFNGVDNLNIFTGNVILDDSEAVLTCDQMRVFLKPASAKQKVKKDKAEFSPVTGTQELDRILCDGNVKIVSKVKDNKTVPPPQPSVITSKRCELDYPANKLVFYENVKVSNKGDTLDCERLDLFLKDSQFKKPRTSTAQRGIALGGRSGSNKTLTRVIASGNVYMKDQESDLKTELMTLDFKELAPGSRKEPGMFTASDVQLIRIVCDGKVVANSFPGGVKSQNGRKRTLKAEHAMSDLIKHRSEFHKNVYLHEDANQLHCRDMYVFTGISPVKQTPAPATAPADDPDADPFELEITENAAPSRIALSDGIDLERIVCKNDVVLINKDKSGKPTHAGGDTAVYTVKTGDIVITANAPRRPYLRRDGRRQYSDIIRGNLRTEELQGDGNVVVVPDNTK